MGLWENLQVNLKVKGWGYLGSDMASTQQRRILKMRQEIADGDESIGTYERPIRDRTDEYTVNVPAQVMDLLDLSPGDEIKVELLPRPRGDPPRRGGRR